MRGGGRYFLPGCWFSAPPSPSAPPAFDVVLAQRGQVDLCTFLQPISKLSFQRSRILSAPLLNECWMLIFIVPYKCSPLVLVLEMNCSPSVGEMAGTYMEEAMWRERRETAQLTFWWKYNVMYCKYEVIKPILRIWKEWYSIFLSWLLFIFSF